PRIGFLSHARLLSEQLAAGKVSADMVLATQRLIFNDRLDAAATALFAAVAVVVLLESARHWWLYLSGRRQPVLVEAPKRISHLAIS
ncbi:MAG TPA: carbon starvation protein A, partial [Candidatus Bathyarchaeia archaeon]|nr:carbon starvation protein A [Candidatus Bathyarchaeia archaeon]